MGAVAQARLLGRANPVNRGADSEGKGAAGSAFEERWGRKPAYLAMAPGRVNLIGEHTDYNGLPVLPMALQRRTWLAFSPRSDGVVRIANADPGFSDVAFELGRAIPASEQGSWANYAKAAAQELSVRHAIGRGFDALVSSDIPLASGLSSSSALVNAVGLALAETNEVSRELPFFAETMASAEQYVGTRGGGMDQAISLGGREGCAAKIDFDPLRMEYVVLPEEWCVVVAHSGVSAEKSATAMAAYNQRRAECEDALRRVCGDLAISGATEAHSSYSGLLDAFDPLDLVDRAERSLHGVLLKRFRHVVSEATRVGDAFRRIVDADAPGMGQLMSKSHESLRADFEVSAPPLDELVAVALEGGALGARLTGAGFGGCVVALTDASSVGSVVETLTSKYYAPRGLACELGDRLFVATPSRGGSVEPT